MGPFLCQIHAQYESATASIGRTRHLCCCARLFGENLSNVANDKHPRKQLRQAKYQMLPKHAPGPPYWVYGVTASVERWDIAPGFAGLLSCEYSCLPGVLVLVP